MLCSRREQKNSLAAALLSRRGCGEGMENSWGSQSDVMEPTDEAARLASHGQSR